MSTDPWVNELGGLTICFPSARGGVQKETMVRKLKDAYSDLGPSQCPSFLTLAQRVFNDSHKSTNEDQGVNIVLLGS